jgi:hypothetical protein
MHSAWIKYLDRHTLPSINFPRGVDNTRGAMRDLLLYQVRANRKVGDGGVVVIDVELVESLEQC